MKKHPAVVWTDEIYDFKKSKPSIHYTSTG
jgi:hypothetical protein